MYLIAPGGGGICGHATLKQVLKAEMEELKEKEAVAKHQVSPSKLKRYARATPYIWVLADVVKYDTRLSCSPKLGTVDWVRQGLPK